MMTKEMLYEAMTTALAPLWEFDAQLMDTDPERWQQFRLLDDQLVMDRDNPAVSLRAYRMKCLQLRALYQGSEKGAQ